MKPDPVETFCRALWKRDGDTIAKLLRRVDPNAKDRWGNTPVLMAAQFGELKVMTVLLDRGGDIEQGRTQLTPLALAARRNASDIVDFLRQRGAAVSLLASIILGDRDRLARELTLDPSCARHTDEGGTPFLHHAAESLHVGMVTLLLDGGASVADADSNGETALHRAADLRPAAQPAAGEMATLLLDRGADPNARNWDNVTPLHQAVRARNLAVAKVLLSRGADPNAKDKGHGSTPLSRAVSATGASGTAGTSALMVPITRLLLEHGANPESQDKRGVSPLKSTRSHEIRALLEEFLQQKRGK